MSARLLLSRTAPRLGSAGTAAGRSAPPPTKVMATRHFSSSSSSSATTTTATLRRVSSTGAALTLALGATSAASPFARTKYHFDAFAAAPAAQGQERAFSSGGRNGKQGGLDPDLVSQLSQGSIAGFLAGLLLSVFSKTLVLLGGVAVVLTQVASKYGIDIVQQLKLKQRIGNSKVLSALERDPAFKLSFGFFFAMSAFIGF